MNICLLCEEEEKKKNTNMTPVILTYSSIIKSPKWLMSECMSFSNALYVPKIILILEKIQIYTVYCVRSVNLNRPVAENEVS